MSDILNDITLIIYALIIIFESKCVDKTYKFDSQTECPIVKEVVKSAI